MTGYLEHPCTKQCAISNLRSFAIDDQHHFLGQVFGQLATARPEEGDELRRKGLEQVSERVFGRHFQEPLHHRSFLEESFVCDRVVAKGRAGISQRLEITIEVTNCKCAS